MFVRCSGIAIAVVLMFMETGFRNALFDSNVRVMQEKITADIVIRSESRYMFSSRQLISFDDVITAHSCAGVLSAEPLYLENAVSEIRCEGCFSRRVRVLAFDPRALLLPNSDWPTWPINWRKGVPPPPTPIARAFFDSRVSGRAVGG